MASRSGAVTVGVVAGAIAAWGGSPGAADGPDAGPAVLAQRDLAAGGTALRCTTRVAERGREVGRSPGVETMRFDAPLLARGRGDVVDFSAGGDAVRVGAEPLAGGVVRHWRTDPRGLVELEVREGEILRYRESFGVSGGTHDRTCER